MTDPYTPTTEEVRAHYILATGPRAGRNGQFDRWLAQHDAALRKQIAREIRAEAEHYGPAWGDGMEYAARLAEHGTLTSNNQQIGD